MKIIAVADLHGNLPEDVPECDLLILAGDICPDYHISNVYQQSKWLLTEFHSWLMRRMPTPVVAVWGNHDFVGEEDPPREELWTLLEDSETKVGGLRIYGTPYTTRYMDWAFMEPDEQLVQRFNRIPEGLDVLISHGPPMWACDRVLRDRGDRLGSKALYDRLRTMQHPPKHVICGHIHGGKGWGTVFGEHGAVEVWNVAGVDEAYTPHEPMWTEVPIGNETKVEVPTVPAVGVLPDQ